jgi:hypothetical protein
VVREGKDGLSFKYVVITGKSLLLADYPPRYVREVVQLSDVTSIRVVSVRSIYRRSNETEPSVIPQGSDHRESSLNPLTLCAAATGFCMKIHIIKTTRHLGGRVGPQLQGGQCGPPGSGGAEWAPRFRGAGWAPSFRRASKTIAPYSVKWGQTRKRILRSCDRAS